MGTFKKLNRIQKVEEGTKLNPSKFEESMQKTGRKQLMEHKLFGVRIHKSLAEAFMAGCTDREACQCAGISKATLYNHQKRHPEFLDQKRVWKNYPIFVARRTIVRALSTDLETARWYAERKMPHEFGRFS